MRPFPRCLLLVAAFLPAAEVALRAARFEYPCPPERIVVRSREEDRAMRADDSLHELDPREMWKPRAGARVPWSPSELVNAAGWRGPEVALARTPGALRIAVLGGSATFGEGVAWRDAYPAVLERILEARGVQAEVVDAGVIGSTVRQGVERYRALARGYEPDLVVAAYSGEDEHRQAPRCVTDDERISAGSSVARRSPTVLSALDPRSALRVAHAAAWIADVLGGSWWPERDFELKEARLAESIGTWDVGGVRRVSLIEFQSSLVTLDREARADGAKLVLLWIPRNPAFHGEAPVLDVYGRVLEDTAQSEGIPLVVGRFALSQAVRAGVAVDDLFLDARNPSECAHSILAQALADEILPLVPGLPRRSRR